MTLDYMELLRQQEEARQKAEAEAKVVAQTEETAYEQELAQAKAIADANAKIVTPPVVTPPVKEPVVTPPIVTPPVVMLPDETGYLIPTVTPPVVTPPKELPITQPTKAPDWTAFIPEAKVNEQGQVTSFGFRKDIVLTKLIEAGASKETIQGFINKNPDLLLDADPSVYRQIREVMGYKVDPAYQAKLDETREKGGMMLPAFEGCPVDIPATEVNRINALNYDDRVKEYIKYGIYPEGTVALAGGMEGLAQYNKKYGLNLTQPYILPELTKYVSQVVHNESALKELRDAGAIIPADIDIPPIGSNERTRYTEEYWALHGEKIDLVKAIDANITDQVLKEVGFKDEDIKPTREWVRLNKTFDNYVITPTAEQVYDKTTGTLLIQGKQYDVNKIITDYNMGELTSKNIETFLGEGTLEQIISINNEARKAKEEFDATYLPMLPQKLQDEYKQGIENNDITQFQQDYLDYYQKQMAKTAAYNASFALLSDNGYIIGGEQLGVQVNPITGETRAQGGTTPTTYRLTDYLIGTKTDDYQINPSSLAVVSAFYPDNPKELDNIIKGVQKVLDNQRAVIEYITSGELSETQTYSLYQALRQVVGEPFTPKEAIYLQAQQMQDRIENAPEIQKALMSRNYQRVFELLPKNDLEKVAEIYDNDVHKDSVFSQAVNAYNQAISEAPGGKFISITIALVAPPIGMPLLAAESVANVVSPYTIPDRTIINQINSNLDYYNDATTITDWDARNYLKEAMESKGIKVKGDGGVHDVLETYQSQSDEVKTEIMTEYTRRQLGFSVSNMQKVLAGAMVIAATLTHVNLSGLIGKWGALGVHAPITGLFIGTSIPTILNPKVKLDDKAIAILFDVLMAKGLIQGAGGTSSLGKVKVPIKTGEVVDKIVPEIEAAISKVIGEPIPKPSLGAIVLAGVRDVGYNIGKTIQAIPKEYEANIARLNNALENINVLAEKVMSGQLSDAIKMGIANSVKATRQGVIDLAQATGKAYDAGIIKLNDALENINVLADNIMSGKYSTAIVNSIKQASIELKNEIAVMAHNIGKGYESLIIKLNDALENINVLADNIMSGKYSDVVKQSLSDALNTIKQGVSDIKQATGKAYENGIIKLNDALENINVLAEKVMSGEISNAIKQGLVDATNTVKQGASNVIQATSRAYESGIIKLNDALENINVIAENVMSGKYSNDIKTAMTDLKNSIVNSRIIRNIPVYYEKAIVGLNDALENINVLAGNIMSGKYSTAISKALVNEINKVKAILAEIRQRIPEIYETSITKLNDALENINVLAEKVMSGEVSDAVSKAFVDAKNNAAQSIRELMGKIGAGYETGIIKLNDALENINVLAEKVMSYDLGENASVALQTMKNALLDVRDNIVAGARGQLYRLQDAYETYTGELASGFKDGMAGKPREIYESESWVRALQAQARAQKLATVSAMAEAMQANSNTKESIKQQGVDISKEKVKLEEKQRQILNEMFGRISENSKNTELLAGDEYVRSYIKWASDLQKYANERLTLEQLKRTLNEILLEKPKDNEVLIIEQLTKQIQEINKKLPELAKLEELSRNEWLAVFKEIMGEGGGKIIRTGGDMPSTISDIVDSYNHSINDMNAVTKEIVNPRDIDIIKTEIDTVTKEIENLKISKALNDADALQRRTNYLNQLNTELYWKRLGGGEELYQANLRANELVSGIEKADTIELKNELKQQLYDVVSKHAELKKLFAESLYRTSEEVERYVQKGFTSLGELKSDMDLLAQNEAKIAELTKKLGEVDSSNAKINLQRQINEINETNIIIKDGLKSKIQRFSAYYEVAPKGTDFGGIMYKLDYLAKAVKSKIKDIELAERIAQDLKNLEDSFAKGDSAGARNAMESLLKENSKVRTRLNEYLERIKETATERDLAVQKWKEAKAIGNEESIRQWQKTVEDTTKKSEEVLKEATEELTKEQIELNKYNQERSVWKKQFTEWEREQSGLSEIAREAELKAQRELQTQSERFDSLLTDKEREWLRKYSERSERYSKDAKDALAYAKERERQLNELDLENIPDDTLAELRKMWNDIWAKAEEGTGKTGTAPKVSWEGVENQRIRIKEIIDDIYNESSKELEASNEAKIEYQSFLDETYKKIADSSFDGDTSALQKYIKTGEMPEPKEEPLKAEESEIDNLTFAKPKEEPLKIDDLDSAINEWENMLKKSSDLTRDAVLKEVDDILKKTPDDLKPTSDIEATLRDIETSLKQKPSEGVPTMMTINMESQLKKLGYTQEQIDIMTPSEAWDIINRQGGEGTGLGAKLPPKKPIPEGGEGGTRVASEEKVKTEAETKTAEELDKELYREEKVKQEETLSEEAARKLREAEERVKKAQELEKQAITVPKIEEKPQIIPSPFALPLKRTEIGVQAETIPFVKSRPIVGVELGIKEFTIPEIQVMPEVQPQIQPLVKPQIETETETQVQPQTETQTKVLTETQTQVQPQTEPLAETQPLTEVQTEVQTETQTETKPQTKTELQTIPIVIPEKELKTTPKPKLIIKPEKEIKYQKQVAKIKPGTACFVQGRPTFKGGRNAAMYKLLPPPYKQEDFFTMRDIPPGYNDEGFTGKGSAYKSLQIIGGLPPNNIENIDLGWARININIEGGKPVIEYVQDEEANVGVRSQTIGMGKGQISVEEWDKAKAEGISKAELVRRLSKKSAEQVPIGAETKNIEEIAPEELQAGDIMNEAILKKPKNLKNWWEEPSYDNIEVINTSGVGGRYYMGRRLLPPDLGGKL